MGLDRVTGSDEHLDDRSGPGGADVVFHLHGLEHDEHLAGFDRSPGRHLDA